MPQGLAAGLLQGYAKGKEQKRERSQADLKAERDKQIFDLTMQKEKFALEKLKTQQKLIEGLMQRFGQVHEKSEGDRQDRRDLAHLIIEAQSQQQGQGQPPIQTQHEIPQQGTPMGESMQQQGGLTDQITDQEMLAMGLSGMAPTASLLQRMRSENRLTRQGDERLVQQTRGNDIREAGFQRGFSEWKGVPITNPDGSAGMMPVPKYGPGLGNVSGAIQTKPGAKNLPIAEQNIPLWVHPETLESAPVGMTPNEAKDKGFVRVTSNTHSKINDFRAVSVLVDQIETLMGNVFPSIESPMGRLGGAIKRTWGAVTQSDKNAALLNSMLQGTQAALVRMFEKGTLTDKDIARARKLNVELTDRADVAWDKIENMKVFIADLQRGFLEGRGKSKKAKPDPLGIR